MVQVQESWTAMPDGCKLYTKSWIPDSPSTPKAVLVFLHGFSDHISAYYNFFPTLASSPYDIAVHGFDQRGWGRSVISPGQAGLTGPSTQVMSDIHEILKDVSSAYGSKAPPLFLMGHSMGGQEALQYVLSTPPRETLHLAPLPALHGLLLEAPYISLDPASQPGAFTVFAGRLASRLMPNKQMVQKLDSTYMSKDPKVRQEWVDDKLCHDTGTLAGLAGMLDRAAQLTDLSHGKTVHGLKLEPDCPVWLGHGGGDRVTSCDASKALFERLEEKDKTLKIYDEAYHKLHAEPDGVGEGFMRDVGEWIMARTETVGVPQGGSEGVKSKL